jgi:hypothetical protein
MQYFPAFLRLGGRRCLFVGDLFSYGAMPVRPHAVVIDPPPEAKRAKSAIHKTANRQ